MCECGDRGQKFLGGVGATPGSCTCCGKTGDVVKLPVGAGHIYNCAPCLNPRGIVKAEASNRQRLRETSVKGIRRGVQYLTFDQLPLGFLRALDNDLTPLINDHPSAQRQKAASRREEEYDE